MTHGLRSEPWRLFFPLGVLALWGGVSHWVLFALGWSDDASSVFHGIAQTQGFVLAIAFGFLLTMLPRRTRSPAPRGPVLAILAAGSVGAAGMVRFGMVRAGESLFTVALVVALVFVLRCMRRGERRAPAAFLWIPLGFALALLGAVLTVIGVILKGEAFRWHEVGKLMVTQGMILCLVIGAGSIALPLMTRGENPPDADRDPDARRVRVVAWFGAGAIAVSCVLEVFVDYALGNLLRAVVSGTVIIPLLRVFEPVRLRGAHRVAMRVAVLMIPLGYLLAALLVPWPRLGLHVVFAGGFAPLALTIALHVALAHGGGSELTERNHPLVVAMLVGLVLALGLRLCAEVDVLHRFAWLGAAGATMLCASLCWAVLVLPCCFRGSTAGGE
ncbi:MAG: NnrS family protein [Planctomycetota bacterium]